MQDLLLNRTFASQFGQVCLSTVSLWNKILRLQHGKLLTYIQWLCVFCRLLSRGRMAPLTFQPKQHFKS